MPIEKRTIRDLLDHLDLYIGLLDRMEIPSPAEVSDNLDVQHLLNHRLHTAVEICIDIGSHIASALKLGGYQEAADVFELLARHRIIDDKLFKNMIDAVKARNVLVHKYADIDYQLVIGNLEDDIADLREFGRQINEFLKKQTSD